MNNVTGDNQTAKETPFTVGLVGLGRPHNMPGATGWAMAHGHARAYNATGECRITALCDIVRENAELFNAEHAEGAASVYTDYEQMLREVKPDIVGICTWTPLHAPIVIAAAKAGVRAIHCEKPMASTWGAAREMVAACNEHRVQLTISHQRRFLNTFQKARTLLQEGAIGELVRMETACPNLFDWGTHWLNMFSMFNDDIPAQWVMGQVDARRPDSVYDVPHETQSMAVVAYQNGVHGLFFGGEGAHKIVGCEMRLTGTKGVIELDNHKPHLQMKTDADTALQTIEVIGDLHGLDAINRTIADVIHCLRTGEKSLVDSSNALQTTEVIFGIYESARRRGRIDLPLTIDDSPFAEMVKAGVFPDAIPAASEERGR